VTTAPASTAVYLDHNATTPIAPEVLDAMRPYLERDFGNPSSAPGYGAAAHEAVVRARSEVAMLLGCDPESVVFTASGSEADNLAIKGIALARRGEGDHIITSAIEHPAGPRGVPLSAAAGFPAWPATHTGTRGRCTGTAVSSRRGSICVLSPTRNGRTCSRVRRRRRR
jgi:hypothetical protein